MKQEWVGTQSSIPSKQITFHKGFNEYDTDQHLAGHNLRADGGRGKNCSMGIQDDSVGKGTCCQV